MVGGNSEIIIISTNEISSEIKMICEIIMIMNANEMIGYHYHMLTHSPIADQSSWLTVKEAEAHAMIRITARFSEINPRSSEI